MSKKIKFNSSYSPHEAPEVRRLAAEENQDRKKVPGSTSARNAFSGFFFQGGFERPEEPC